MTFFKYFHYAYIVFAVLFLYDAFLNWGETKFYASLALGGLALFMFFFRGKFNKRFKK